MPIVLLLILLLACLPENWPSPPGMLGFWGSLGLTWLSVAAGVAAAGWVARRVCRALFFLPGEREAVLQRYHRDRLLHLGLLVLLYALALYVFGWGWVVRELCSVGTGPDRWLLPGLELLRLAPFLLSLLLSWACFYDAERTLHDTSSAALEGRPFWNRGEYVSFQARNNLVLVLVPIGMVVLQQGVLRLVPEAQSDWRFQLAAVVAVAVAFVCLPLLLRVVLGWQPLPAGQLRARLEQAAARLHFHCTDILLWPTRGGVANALVVGVVPRLRYVVLTDRLLEQLTPDEVEAVFGHEVGHVKHRHMLYYLGFLMVSLTVVAAVWQVGFVAVWDAAGFDAYLDLNVRDDLAVLPLLAVLGTYIFAVFGFLSRRCERQADVYGCRAVSCGRPDCAGHDDQASFSLGKRGLCPTGIRTFMEALEKVARLNGISRDKPGLLQSWQHGTIARRVEFLQRMIHDPKLEPRFQRRVWLVKAGVLAVLVGILIVLGACLGWGKVMAL